MKQKINILVSGAVCCIILMLLVMIGVWTKNTEAVSGEPVMDYEQLDLYVKSDHGTEIINIWKDEAECYYFFLPSYAIDSQILFGNLTEEDRVVIYSNTAKETAVLVGGEDVAADNLSDSGFAAGEMVFSYADNIVGSIEYNVTYEMQLNINGEILAAQPLVFMCSENIPAVFIETETGTMDSIHSDKEIKEPAALTVIHADGSVEYSDSIEYIKARGNSTFTEVEKKSYQLKLFNKKSLLGMEKAKKWLLLANAKDDSLIRNAVVYDFTSRYTDVASVEGKFVDVYLNGDYTGNYYLCEKVEVSESRLDIIDLDKQNEVVNSQSALENGNQYISPDGSIRAVAGLNNPDDITGGYLLEKIVEEEYAQTRSGFLSSMGHYYCVVCPENASVEQVEYISTLVNELECAISQPDGIHPDTGKHYSEYMDVESWTSKYLIEEFFSDPDSPAASAYLYKDADSVDSRIYFGPVWDYDRTMGGYAVSVYFIDDPKQIGYRGIYATQLLEFEEVKNKVLEKYEAYVLPYLQEDAEETIADAQKEIAVSAQMNRVRWPQIIGYYAEWEANGDYLLSFLQDRAEYLTDVWMEEEQYHTVTFLDYYGAVYDTYKVKHGEYLNVVPEIAAYVAIFNGWKSTATGKNFDVRLPVLEDAVYQSSWIGADIVLANGLAMGEIDISKVDVDALEALLEAVKQMQEGADE